MITDMWQHFHFSELPNGDLYEMLQLRTRVFILEQNCVYLDEDDRDQDAIHLFKKVDGVMAAYCRLLAPGVGFREASIGRVITHPEFRTIGLGKEMMPEAIRLTKEIYNVNAIRIGAQCYLEKFYASFGFVTDSEMYLEDDIPHVEMIYRD